MCNGLAVALRCDVAHFLFSIENTTSTGARAAAGQATSEIMDNADLKRRSRYINQVLGNLPIQIIAVGSNFDFVLRLVLFVG